MSETAIRHRIAGEVRAALARHQKTQRELAERLGITQPAVHARLAGGRSFRAEELAMIAAWLDEPIGDLIQVAGMAVGRA